MNVYILNVIAVTPSSLTFATPTSAAQNIVVSQVGTAAWSEFSQISAVATVAQGAPATTFIVKPKAVGSTKVVISDSKGNSFAVLVTVQ